jgi:hypothetical protein
MDISVRDQRSREIAESETRGGSAYWQQRQRGYWMRLSRRMKDYPRAQVAFFKRLSENDPPNVPNYPSTLFTEFGTTAAR